MAVRTDATGEGMVRSTGLPSITSFTMMCWARIRVDTNAHGAFLVLQKSSGNYYTLGFAGDGTTLESFNTVGLATGSALTVDTWYHVCMTVAGTGVGQFLSYLNGVLDITSNGIGSLTTVGSMRVGRTDDGNDTNAAFAAVKVWDGAVLTATEILQEMRQYLPVRMLNLNTFLPCLGSTTDVLKDFSGGGRDMTAEGTLSVEDGPGIPWKRGIPRPTRVLATIAGAKAAAGTFQSGTGAAGTAIHVGNLTAFQGQRPKAVLLVNTGRTGTGQAEGNLRTSIGFAVSPTLRGGQALWSAHGAGASECKAQTFTDAAMKTIDTALDGAFDLQSMDPNGFTLVVDDAFLADYICTYLAIGGADLTHATVGTFACPGSAGNQDVTGLGFQPDALFVLGPADTLNTIEAHGRLSLGMVDTSLDQCVTATSAEDAVGTSITSHYAQSGECLASFNPGTADKTIAAVTAWLSDGFRLNWSSVISGRDFVFLAVKGGSWRLGNALTATSLTTVTVGESGQPAPRGIAVASTCSPSNATSGLFESPAEFSIGFASGASAQNNFGFLDKDAAGTTDIGRRAATSDVYSNESTAATIVNEGLMELTSFGTGTSACTFTMTDADPSQNRFWATALGDTPAGGSFTISCDVGSYALTGTTASLEYGREVAADVGSYALTGTAASLERGYPLVADVGSYALTGTAATFPHTWRIAADVGSYTVSGVAASLERGYPLVAEVGSYMLSGTAASLERGYPLVAAVGAYALTGTTATFPRTWVVKADTGSYALTGTTANPEWGRLLVAAVGSYALSGVTASLEHGYVLVGAVGSYALTGIDAVFSLSGDNPVLSAEPGSYALTGTTTSLEWGHLLVGAVGSYALTGVAVSLERGYPLIAQAGSYTLNGTSANLYHGWKIAAAPGAYTLSGVAAGLSKGHPLVATPGSYTLTGLSATFPWQHVLTAETGAYVLTGVTATLVVGLITHPRILATLYMTAPSTPATLALAAPGTHATLSLSAPAAQPTLRMTPET